MVFVEDTARLDFFDNFLQRRQLDFREEICKHEKVGISLAESIKVVS